MYTERDFQSLDLFNVKLRVERIYGYCMLIGKLRNVLKLFILRRKKNIYNFRLLERRYFSKLSELDVNVNELRVCCYQWVLPKYFSKEGHRILQRGQAEIVFKIFRILEVFFLSLGRLSNPSNSEVLCYIS
jgi:hypothetical protein